MLLLTVLLTRQQGACGTGQQHHSSLERDSRSKHSKYTADQLPVELIRFITGYKAPLEVLVDITPLLQYLGDDGYSTSTFYAFVDTWASNDSMLSYIFLSNVTGQCTPIQKNGGNGWSLTVDLVLWNSTSSSTSTTSTTTTSTTSVSSGFALAGVVPKLTVTISPGFDGGNPNSGFGFGKITVHEGVLTSDRKSVLLDKAVDLAANGQATNPPIYLCNSANDLHTAAYWGLLSRPAVVPGTLRGDGTLENIEFSFLSSLYSNKLVGTRIQSVSSDGTLITVTLTDAGEPSVGMVVYFSSNIYSPREFNGTWFNSSFGFSHVGNVTAVDGKVVTIQLNNYSGCITSSLLETYKQGLLILPQSATILASTNATVMAAASWGMANINYGLGSGSCFDALLLNESNVSDSSAAGGQNVSFSLMESIGRVSLTPPAQSSVDASGSHVCIVHQSCQGRLFSRSFNVTLLPGDVALLHLITTAHGWEYTTEQCGEYCEALYNVRLNGANTANVSEFRDWCKLNPTGPSQHGTWDESRNGWCPGSVQPGLYFDVTQSILTGVNTLDFDLFVKSNVTGQHELYTDFSGWPLNNGAIVYVTASLVVFDAASVAKVRARQGARTAVEAALQTGSSAVSSGQGTVHMAGDAPAALVAMEPSPISGRLLRSERLPRSQSHRDEYKESLLEKASSPDSAQLPFDFEARAPWYSYNSNASADGSVRNLTGANVVNLFQDALMQGARRNVTVEIGRQAFSGVWQQAALHLQIGQPVGLEMDHWDHTGGVGIVLRESSLPPGVKVAAMSHASGGNRLWSVAS